MYSTTQTNNCQIVLSKRIVVISNNLWYLYRLISYLDNDVYYTTPFKAVKEIAIRYFNLLVCVLSGLQKLPVYRRQKIEPDTSVLDQVFACRCLPV